MMGGKGGVLSPEQARQLMDVLGEMTEYVDEEDLEGISAQKPIYEVGSESAGTPLAPTVDLGPPDMGDESQGSGMRRMRGVEVMPHGAMETGMETGPMPEEEEMEKAMGRPGRLDRRR